MRKILILLMRMTALVSDENDFDDNVIFDEKDGDVEVEIKVINRQWQGRRKA